MTRATQTLSLGLLLTSLYLLCLTGAIPFPQKFQEDVLPVLPLWSLISFACFTLARLGYGVLTLKDTPDAYSELMREVDEARKDLRLQGVDVD